MPVPPEVRQNAEQQLDAYCAKLVPEHAYGKVRIGYVVTGMTITLFEQHPHFRDEGVWTRNDIVRIKFNMSSALWTLFWRDQHAKWHIYGRIAPTPTFAKILKEIEADPTALFWG